MAKRALITGITGQDGAYLAKLLLDNGYEVYGAHRRTSLPNMWRLAELGIESQVRLVAMDLLEFGNILRTIGQIRPDEIYNLAAQSFVGVSFDQPIYTSEVDALGVARLLEAIRLVCPEAKFYQASTSEMFGKVQETPQSERTPFHPCSPYAVAKVYAHWITVNYREAHGLFACSGILFNHESPLRSREFVTRKITSGLAQIRHGRREVLQLGNLESKRDWGFAQDYVFGIWQMLQQEHPEDFVLATGQSHSVREFADLAAHAAGYSLAWEGERMNACGIDRKTGQVVIKIDSSCYRPSDAPILVGSAGKAQKKLCWRPQVYFADLVTMMVRTDMDRAGKGMLLS